MAPLDTYKARREAALKALSQAEEQIAGWQQQAAQAQREIVFCEGALEALAPRPEQPEPRTGPTTPLAE